MIVRSKKIILFSCLTIALSLNAMAQATFLHNDIIDLLDIVNARHRYDPSVGRIQGSPYYIDSFVVGNIYFVEKAAVENVPIRYNIYSDAIEYFQNDHIMELLPIPKVEKALIGKEAYVFIEERGDHKLHGFFRMLADGEYRLLLKMRVKFEEAQAAQALQDARPAAYKRQNDQLYWQKQGGPLVRFKSVKKFLQESGNDDAKTIKYAKTQKINKTIRWKLVELFDFVNK